MVVYFCLVIFDALQTDGRQNSVIRYI